MSGGADGCRAFSNSFLFKTVHCTCLPATATGCLLSADCETVMFVLQIRSQVNMCSEMRVQGNAKT
ncbi:hypothetical protein DXB70_05225 [Clostridium sp. OM05-5BH]|nr:hypothetical protein DXB70_05225 [Clostridium sp. OM05-5BH]